MTAAKSNQTTDEITRTQNNKRCKQLLQQKIIKIDAMTKTQIIGNQRNYHNTK